MVPLFFLAGQLYCGEATVTLPGKMA
jgi:hypothetical protein